MVITSGSGSRDRYHQPMEPTQRRATTAINHPRILRVVGKKILWGIVLSGSISPPRGLLTCPQTLERIRRQEVASARTRSGTSVDGANGCVRPPAEGVD